MNKLSVAVALAVAAVLALASPALAQKGKGQGKGGGASPAPGKVLPGGPGKANPARPFEHPSTDNSLPPSTLDKLPPGLRDKPENHPGLTNHLRKLVEDKPLTNFPSPSPVQSLTPDQQATRLFAQPRSGNSLTQGILERLPLGLREMPNNQPGLANYLRQLIPPATVTPSAPAPIPAQPVQPLRFFRRR
jgi:hypothetical protein